jgi:2'-5' RNA ligase
VRQPRRRRYRGTYVGFNLRITSDVRGYRDLLCERFRLLPRQELHLTLGYLGTVDYSVVQGVAQFMRGAKHVLPSAITLELSGIGAACQLPTGTTIPLDDRDSAHLQWPRVAWWAVRPSSPLVGMLRERYAKALKRHNLDVSEFGDSWAPHITIGSAGPRGSLDDFSRWNTQGMPKGSTTASVRCPSQVDVDRLHITNGDTQPDSLAVVWICWNR